MNLEKIGTKILTLAGEFKPPEQIGSGFCEECQQHYIIYQNTIIGGELKGQLTQWKKGCICEDRQLAKETLEDYSKMQKRKRLEEFERLSLIPPALIKASFQTFKAKNESQEVALLGLMDFVMNFSKDAPMNVVLAGTSGVGKSHLSVGVVKELMTKGYSAIFCSVPRLLSKIKSSFNPNNKYQEEDYIKMLEDVDVLVLDDLGQERLTDWTTDILYQIIDARAGKHTIFTTNFSSKEIRTRFGDARFSRVINKQLAFKVEGADERLQ